MPTLTDVPKPEEVRAQLERLYAYSKFRGPKLRRLLGFLVEEWLRNKGKHLSLMFIGASLKDEDLTLETVTRSWESEEERAEREYTYKTGKKLRKTEELEKGTDTSRKTGRRIKGQKYSYPKTRANLGHVRKRLRRYYDTQGYRDPVIILLNAGSYVPVISYNSVSIDLPKIDPFIERLLLRAKTAMDARTVSGAIRAGWYIQAIEELANTAAMVSQGIDLTSAEKTPELQYQALQSAWVARGWTTTLGWFAVAFLNWTEVFTYGLSPHLAIKTIFLKMVAASIMPSRSLQKLREPVEETVQNVKKSGFEPWECAFVEGCVEACFRHHWTAALELFELAVLNSQGEAKYYWWYPALLASRGRMLEGIDILDSAVRHFSRTNIATRTDLAMLQIMAGRFDDAEETLQATLDFTSDVNPVMIYSFAVLYEAQDRLDEANAMFDRWFDLPNEDPRWIIEQSLTMGMWGLTSGRSGQSIFSEEDLASVITSDCSLIKRLDVTHRSSEEQLIYGALSAMNLALILLGNGSLDGAVHWLRIAAFQETTPFSMWFHIYPPLRHLHGHPGFKRLLKDLDLPLQRSL